ncbi:MAG: hypothetical protein LBI49_00980 [Nocardiopsaceae bacterium]|jgi:hypothetical protein|nr:hypothetical protein [Nocardiopsaceae bacterium]
MAGFGDVTRILTALTAVRRHWIFAIALCLGLAIRVIAMIGFPPAIWFGGDSASYLSTALRHAPGTSRLSGYGVMLMVLRPFRSFTLVVGVQHLLGLAVAVMIYAVARRYRLPAWGAALAALPVLFDAYQIQLEHEILPSVPFGFLVMAAVTLIVWWRRDRPAWATVTAGVLLAVSATIWPVGLPLLLLYVLYLLLRRTGWRAFAVTVVAAAVPLGGYLFWFNSAYGEFAFSNSDGIYLWSRTMTFANCAVIRPPASEAGLCPHRPLTGRPAASSFIWIPDTPLNNLPRPKFSARNNSLAMNFALRAISAQPGGYARAVAGNVAKSFTWNRPAYPSHLITNRYEFRYATKPTVPPGLVVIPGYTLASLQRAYGGVTTTRAVQPFSGFLIGYQRYVYLRGTLLGVILLIGLAGVVRSWRRGGIRRLADWGGPGLFPWAATVALLIVPVLTADFDPRYVLISMPAACLAGALAFARPAAADRPAGEPAGAVSSRPAAPGATARR